MHITPKSKANMAILLSLSVIVVFLFVMSSINRLSIEQIRNLTGGGYTSILYIDTFPGRKITRNNYTSAVYEIEGFRGGCEIRGHGNTTWYQKKKPYLLKLEKEEPLLGMGSSKKWVLMANQTDKTALRNKYGQFLATKIWNNQKWTPDSRYIALFLNGKYNGLYELTEKIELNKLDLPEPDSFLAVINAAMNKEHNFQTEKGIRISIRMKKKTEEEYQAMEKIIQHAEDVLFSDDFKDPVKGWRCVMDEDSFIDWYLINEFTKNNDAVLFKSCFFYYDSKIQKLFMGPIWDMDLSCGNVNFDDRYIPEKFWIKTSRWYKRLFEDECFSKKAVERYREKRKEIQSSFDWIEEEAEKLKPLIKQNDTLWNVIGKNQWPNAPGWKNRKTYESEVEYMIDFLQKRAEWLDKEFR